VRRPEAHPASFRDPSGRIVLHRGLPYREVSADYLPHLRRLDSSGLLARLTRRGDLLRHRVLKRPYPFATHAAALLAPEPLPFISHPYEWCFSQWREAALLTLRLARDAADSGMTLKDASAYNVQFLRGRAVWIDTLSFEEAGAPAPWVAYRQFCRHFLATLAGMSRVHERWGLYFRSRMDGFDLREAARALPASAWLDPFLAGHLLVQSRLENRPLRGPDARRVPRMSPAMLRGLLEDLSGGVARLKAPRSDRTWSRYGERLPYPPRAASRKRRVVDAWVRGSGPDSLWDLGANTGDYALSAARRVPFVLALDSDHASVEALWDRVRSRGVRNVLPLWMDLSDPSPAQGWENRERSSLLERGPADLALALALVHHLAFSSLVPLERQAGFFARCARRLVLEFPGPSDPQVRALAAGRGPLLSSYRREALERGFAPSFLVIERTPLPGCDRVLYLMERRGSRP
jgi:hypothetical protein